MASSESHRAGDLFDQKGGVPGGRTFPPPVPGAVRTSNQRGNIVRHAGMICN
jgi:hypothetical protein